MDELNCPSVNAEHATDPHVLGIIVDGRVRYLEHPEPLTEEHHEAARSRGVAVEEIFRLTATCYHCREHWTGTKCGLVARIPHLVLGADLPSSRHLPGPPLPPCGFKDDRSQCRHYFQAGRDICRFCPCYSHANVVLPKDMARDAPIGEHSDEWL